MTNPNNFAGLDRGHFLSSTGNCNTFDDSANGYCRADESLRRSRFVSDTSDFEHMNIGKLTEIAE